MIKELIFQKQKWYQGEVPNYVGKTLKMPNGSCYTYTFNLGKDSSLPKDEVKDPQVTINYDDLWPQDLSYKLTPKVIGQLEAQNSTFLLIPFYDHIFNHTHCVWIKLSEYLQNGGVLGSLLIHICQAFKRAFTRNEVIACL